MTARRPTWSAPPAGHPRFAHESERRFARILDFYGVPWEYEPVEFVLQWDDEGRPAAGFRAGLLAPRAGAVRGAHHPQPAAGDEEERQGPPAPPLYPDVRVKILYQRDILGLLEKYGLGGERVGHRLIARSA